MAAAFADISADWLQGNWGDTLTVVGPALAALGLISLPRGVDEPPQRRRGAAAC